MKTIFDEATRNELIKRVNSLDENSKAQWGKMNIFQMVKHCTLYEKWLLGKNNPEYKQAFIGQLFGKMALKDIIKDKSPLKRNTPTLATLKVKENSGNVADEKKKWNALIEEYENFTNPNFIHTFFGKMTKEKIGYMA